MSDHKPRTWLVVCCALLGLVVGGDAQVPPRERGPDDPVWVQWMRPDSPDDQTTLHFWELYKSGELDPEGIVDLGTMLFHRGFPNDAVRMYREALRADSGLYESWFRIGLVKDHLGEPDDARHAYNKCLKIAPNHGWCAFYLALLEEKTGHPSKALELYRLAFESAPELADASVNPELLESRLYLGALLLAVGRDAGTASRRMSGSEAVGVESIQSPQPSGSPVQMTEPGVGADRQGEPSQPAAQAPARSAEQTSAPAPGAPTVAAVSPEASLAPPWSRLPKWILALV